MLSTKSLMALVFAAACMLAAPGAAAAAEELPVPWVADFSAQGTAANAPPAGANDWDCEPSRRHPDPVILVHGLIANRTLNWPTISPFLANHGYCVFALTYGTRDSVDLGLYQPGGLVKMQQSARKLKRFAGKVMQATDTRQVDIVGHSEGSLMPNWWVKRHGGWRVVDDYVAITPLWDGTNLAAIGLLDALGQRFGLDQSVYAGLEPFCVSCHQFTTESRFIRLMNAGSGPAAPGVDYTTLITRNDELVNPYTSGLMNGAKNIIVQRVCPLDQSEHLSIAFDPITAYSILNALDPKHPHEVPCVPVLPGLGAVGYTD